MSRCLFDTLIKFWYGRVIWSLYRWDSWRVFHQVSLAGCQWKLMTSHHSLASRRYHEERKRKRDGTLPDWTQPAINRWLNAVPTSDGGRDMKLIQVLQAYPVRRLYLRVGISGILRLLERKDPSMRISRKLETLVGRPELSTLHRTVVRHGHRHFVIRPGDHYTYPRSLYDLAGRKYRNVCGLYALSDCDVRTKLIAEKY